MRFRRLLPASLLTGVLALLSGHSEAVSITFGSGANQFEMDFVDITGGDVADDTNGTPGAVEYDYRIGTYEVSRSMIEVYNSLSGGPAITMEDMTNFGGNGANRPAVGLSWNEAARFVNWLNTSQGHSPAYNILGNDVNDHITLWGPGDPGYDPANLFRNSNAVYFLPSEDEWYRAAYYDPTVGAYWDYATGSDTQPIGVSGGTAAGTAVYNFQSGPANIDDAGGLSPFGTMAQNGNVWEWTESGSTAPNDSPEERRVFRGGSWRDDESQLCSGARVEIRPELEDDVLMGIRVATIPEPSGLVLVLVGVLGVVLRRRRG